MIFLYLYKNLIFFNVIAFAALIAVAQAGAIGYATPQHYSTVTNVSAPEASVVYNKVATKPVASTAPALKITAPVAYAVPADKVTRPEEDTPANYQFSYGVNDPLSGDNKNQEEQREGDVVKGSYSLIEADGSKRIVEYTSDPHYGFIAIVHNEPAKVTVKTVAPVTKVVAPVAYSAPAYAAPAAYSAPSYYHH